MSALNLRSSCIQTRLVNKKQPPPEKATGMECPHGRGQFPLQQEGKGTIHVVMDVRILLKME